MVDVKELRVGNWVECTFIGRVQVSKEDIGDWPALGGMGIDLTPEIIEACGFERTIIIADLGNGVQEYPQESWMHPQLKAIRLCNNKHVTEGGEKDYKIMLGDNILMNLEYLHTLQNNFFYLAGAELTYTPQPKTVS